MYPQGNIFEIITRKGKGRGGSTGSFTMSAEVEDVDAVVVGSGISGSTAAFYMNKNNINVVLAEARNYAGGNLISKKGT